APYGREHREARPPVVLPASVREGPEVSRRPEEDEEGDQDRLQADRIRCRGGPGERRAGTGESADDDVAHVGPLESDRVDADVNGIAESDHHGRQEVDAEPRDGEAQDQQTDAELEGGVRRLKPVVWQRCGAGSVYD